MIPEFSDIQRCNLDMMMSGELYQAANPVLLDILSDVQEQCFRLNNLSPSMTKEREAILRRLLGRTGERFKIISPFFCDYGFNIEVGENFFANTNLVILDEAKVTFGDNVFIGSGTHIQYDTKIGSNVIIGTCSVVTHDIPDNSVVAGVPARVIGSFDDYVEKRMKEAPYPDRLKPRGQTVSPELAELLWKRFDEKHKG